MAANVVEDRIAAALSEKSATFSHQVAARVAVRVLPGIGWIIPHADILPWLRATLTSVVHSMSLDAATVIAAEHAASSVPTGTKRFLHTLSAIKNPRGHNSALGSTNAIRSAIFCSANGSTPDLYISERASATTRRHALETIRYGSQAYSHHRSPAPLLREDGITYRSSAEDAVDAITENFKPEKWSALWAHSALPMELELGWTYLGVYFDEFSPLFVFWREWYEGFLSGAPMDWELQRRVALIPNEDWLLGPAHIATKIEEIKATYLAEKLPLAETVEINPETGNFRAVPIPVQNLPLMGALLSRVRDAVEDAVQGNNGLNERAREVRVLTRAVDRYGNDPQRIEMDFTSVAIGLRRQFETQDLPQSEDNLALLEAVEDGVRGIRATHQDVAKNRLVLAQQTWREMAPADKVLLAEAQPILVALSDGALAEDFAADIPALINDAIGPPTSFAPRLPGADEATRLFGRVAKMAPLSDKLLDTGAQWHDSRAHKLAKLGFTVASLGTLLIALVRLGLKLLGVL